MSRASSNVSRSRWTDKAEVVAGQSDQPVPLLLHIRGVRDTVAAGTGHRRIRSVTGLGACPPGACAANQMDTLLAEAPLSVAVRPDVYRGLAWLFSAESPVARPYQGLRAVLVCMDGLGRQELEFFSILSRLHPSLPVYVYGDARSESWIARAIELGAAGRATEKTVRALIDEILSSGFATGDGDAEETGTASDNRATAETLSVFEATNVAETAPALEQPSCEPHVGEEPAGDPSQNEPSPNGAPPIESPAAQASPTTASLGADGDAGEDGVEAAVRVPWLRYDDGPVRAAPQDDTPFAEGLDRVGPPRRQSDAAEPLLTEEELRALMGTDDIAALAPEQGDVSAPDGPNAPLPDERNGGGGGP